MHLAIRSWARPRSRLRNEKPHPNSPRQHVGGWAGNGGRAGPGVRPTAAFDGDGGGRRRTSSNSWGRIIGYTVLSASVVVISLNERQKKEFARWVAQHGSSGATVTIVVPALNEEAGIREQVAYLKALEPPPLEVVVVDGGSTDRTMAEARAAGATVLSSPRGRAKQMNAGGREARGELLCFVHADTKPPPDLTHIVRYELCNPRTVAGGVCTRVVHQGKLLWWMTFHHFVKTYYMPMLMRPIGFFHGLRCVLGDQTIFMRRQDLLACAGYDESLPIMEDADLTIRLHEGRHLIPPKRRAVRHVLYRSQETSGRRMVAWGPVYTTYIHFLFGLTWLLDRKAAPAKLQQMYKTLYGDAPR